MPKLMLPVSGQEVQIGVYHKYWDAFCEMEYDEPSHVLDLQRTTRVRLTDGTQEMQARSVVKGRDQFCKREGRRRAAMNLLRKVKNLAKADRRAIFMAICPEYATTPEDRQIVENLRKRTGQTV
jgi:hypothetical protein